MVYNYKVAKHSVYNINYHLVFCPKRRKSVLVDDIVLDLEQLFTDLMVTMGCKIEQLSIEPDHVHLFISAPPNISPHLIIKNLKGNTSKFLRDKYPQLKKLPTMWSRSYYIGTVGFVSESVVKNYIANQKSK